MLIFTDGNEQSTFESYFVNADKNSVREGLKNNAVLQHKINQEETELKGKPICGVLEYAVVYTVHPHGYMESGNRAGVELLNL